MNQSSTKSKNLWVPYRLVAQALRVSPYTVQRYVDKGALPGRFFFTVRRLYLDDIEPVIRGFDPEGADTLVALVCAEEQARLDKKRTHDRQARRAYRQKRAGGGSVVE